MKAILVLDEMPRCCDECQLNYDMGFGCDGFALDDYTPIDMKEMRDDTKRPSWCPLKEMPKKLHVYDQTIFDYEDVGPEVRGWNRCIEEILK